MDALQLKKLKREINLCRNVKQLQFLFKRNGKFELSEEFQSEQNITKAKEMALFLVENYNTEPMKLFTEDEFYTQVCTNVSFMFRLTDSSTDVNKFRGILFEKQ